MRKLRSLVAYPLLGALFVPQLAWAQAPSIRQQSGAGLRVQTPARINAPMLPSAGASPSGGASGAGAGAAGAAGAAQGSAKPPATMSMNDVRQQPEMTKPPSYMVDFTLEDADLTELITMISTLTGKRFIFNAKIRNIKVNVYAPKNQKISVAEAYQTFLSILDANGLTIVPQGKFLKIVDSGGVVTQTTPLYGHGEPVPAEDRYVTRLYRLSHIGADEVAALLGKFKSKDGDITVHGPGNLLIITDTAANIRRMLQLVEEVDVGGAGEQVWVEPIHYAAANEIAQKLTDTFEVKGPAPAGKPGAPQAGGEVRITKIITEERTNSLIIVATERAYLRMLELIRRLDVPQSGEGEIHVLPLQHAMAEELSQTLNQILGGAGGMPPATGPRSNPQAAAAGGAAPAAVFEGSVRVTADKATNSLVVTSSLRDYASLRNVIDKLDMPRRQVFIEAVIMDMSVDHSTKLGLSYHGGAAPNLGGGSNSLAYGGLYPMKTMLLPSPDDLQGLALGVRGPEISGTSNLLGTGLSIPAFGVMLNALSSSGDANVLATPHIIATDNVPAEINVGENIPLQTNVGGVAGLPNLGGAAGGAGGMAGLAGLAGLGALGGYGGMSVPRQDVGTKIKVVPHINDSDEVRLEITEEISEQGATSGMLGVVSITKRNAQTTIVVKDQQTVVIGGLMRDAVTTSQDKIPVLGDIPVLGALFRQSRKGTRKTNLLLILTPYVIRDQNDLKAIFERKMQERQEFLDRYFVFSDQKRYEPPRDFSRTNGLVEDIRQAFFKIEEKRRLEEESRPRDVKVHEPSQPIEFPMQSGSGGVGPQNGAMPMMPMPMMPMMPGAPGAPPMNPPPAPAPEARRAPLHLNSPMRSVNVQRTE